MSSKGTFENLVVEPIPDADAPLEHGQVRIAVRTMAANFRDVMIALGLYPDEDAVMGIEASGIVVETGSDGGRFAVGDRVMGLFPEGTGSVAVTDARLLMPIPTGWSLRARPRRRRWCSRRRTTRCATLADVQPGQSVLIHAGAGGVGMAASSWPGTSVPRCSPPPAGASGTRCGPWASTTTTSATRARANSRTSSAPRPAVAVSTSCSTRWPATSSMPHCDWSHRAGCSWRWARPTSANRT